MAAGGEDLGRYVGGELVEKVEGFGEIFGAVSGEGLSVDREKFLVGGGEVFFEGADFEEHDGFFFAR